MASTALARPCNSHHMWRLHSIYVWSQRRAQCQAYKHKPDAFAVITTDQQGAYPASERPFIRRARSFWKQTPASVVLAMHHCVRYEAQDLTPCSAVYCSAVYCSIAAHSLLQQQSEVAEPRYLTEDLDNEIIVHSRSLLQPLPLTCKL
eukprot:10228-Heterococcus_DN1.PRE.1